MKSFLLAACAFCASTAFAADPPSPAAPAAPAASAPAATASAPAPSGEEQALYTVKMFMELCAVPQADPPKVRAAAERSGFRPLLPEALPRFLGQRPGEGWALQLALGAWVLTLDRQGVCSVVVHKVDTRALEDATRAWLPRTGAGYTVDESARTLPNGLRVTSWQVREGGKPHGIWVLSTSTAADAFFQGALSMQLAK